MRIERIGSRLAGIPLTVSVALAIGAWPGGVAAQDYDPQIDPAAFSADVVGNPYFSLPVGKKMVYSAETEEGLERIEILVPGWTRTVMGVETLVFWDRVFLNGQLIEDTRDYLAQHENGDVWYFGENVDNYEDGVLVDHEGAWMGGVDGALPGIWMPGEPRVGDKYRQEYYAGQAEDAAEVLSLSEEVTTPFGTFADCLKIFEWSPLFSATAHKYYCLEPATVTLEVDLVGPETDVETRTELIEVDMSGALGVPLPAAYAEEGVVAAAGSDDGGEGDDDETGDRDTNDDSDENDDESESDDGDEEEGEDD